MPDAKISALTALTGAGAANDDLVPVVDTSATETKKMTFPQFFKALAATLDTADKPIFPGPSINTATVCVGASTVGLTGADGFFLGMRDTFGLGAAIVYGRLGVTSALDIVINPYANGTGVSLTLTDKGSAKVVASPGGAAGYLRQGGRMLSSSVTTTSTTLSNLTALSTDVWAGQKLRFRATLFVTEGTAADGVKLDFDGGTATFSTARFQGTIQDTGGISRVDATTAIATDITQATVTGASVIVIEGALIVSAEGTFIPRIAKNSDASGGTLTVHPGSNITLEDMG